MPAFSTLSNNPILILVIGVAILIIIGVILFRLAVWLLKEQIRAGLVAEKLARQSKGTAPQPPQVVQIDPNAQALAILNQRLARGEISPEQYQMLRATIEQKR